MNLKHYDYRLLGPSDSLAYRQLRLESLKLEPESFGASYTEQIKLPKLYFEKLLEQQDSQRLMLGAFDGQTLFGLCGLVPEEEAQIEIIQMYVAPAYRGQGVGLALLALAKDCALNGLQAQALVLRVFKHNTAAVRSYLKTGFEAVEAPDKTGADELYMRCSLR